MSELRLHLEVRGAVQGVGFRPLVFSLARAMGLCGWVRNRGAGVEIEVQGERAGEFPARLRASIPSHARIDALEVRGVASTDAAGFFILESVHRDDVPGTAPPRVIPDLVTCPDCLREIFDPSSRFFRYPFTNCTHCGPRYSIVERVPYDRAHTTMRGFVMCPACRTEYQNPADRRFHAQPTACPACGPRLELRDAARPLATGDEALLQTARALRDGALVALKGMGGFQLLALAQNRQALLRLRQRKHRPHKPLALMARDLEQARRFARIDAAEAELLASSAGPIVLLERHDATLPAEIAPDQQTLGIMLPSTPLHHLLLAELDGPVVCTSGNRADEPICTDNDEALARLDGIADLWLLHDRPIRRAVDDSVARVIDGVPQILRAARGYAPTIFPGLGSSPAMALGPHLKNSLALHGEGRSILSQHIGDLENALAVDALQRTADDLAAFFDIAPGRVGRDLHPDYASSQLAEASGPPTTAVQHHLAHALACMVEHDLPGPLLAVVWDGAGLGPDGTIWGGEFLRVERRNGRVHWSRFAHLLPFPLPGGDAASRDARRALSGLAWETEGISSYVDAAHRPLLQRGLNAPRCSSMGRLFDGVSALLKLCEIQTYEGQAAIRLESRATDDLTERYDLPLDAGRLDWRPTLRAMARERDEGVPAGVISARFHNALIGAIIEVARAALAPDERTVVLTGGCFQNRRLTEGALRGLREAGFLPVIARRAPPNDGGVALGQLVAVLEEAVQEEG